MNTTRARSMPKPSTRRRYSDCSDALPGENARTDCGNRCRMSRHSLRHRGESLSRLTNTPKTICESAMPSSARMVAGAVCCGEADVDEPIVEVDVGGILPGIVEPVAGFIAELSRRTGNTQQSSANG